MKFEMSKGSAPYNLNLPQGRVVIKIKPDKIIMQFINTCPNCNQRGHFHSILGLVRNCYMLVRYAQCGTSHNAKIAKTHYKISKVYHLFTIHSIVDKLLHSS